MRKTLRLGALNMELLGVSYPRSPFRIQAKKKARWFTHLAFVFQLSKERKRALKEGGIDLKAEADANRAFIGCRWSGIRQIV